MWFVAESRGSFELKFNCGSLVRANYSGAQAHETFSEFK